jgi:hypothetical protein
MLFCILSLGKISPLLSSFIIGCGLGLISDDVKDLKSGSNLKDNISIFYFILIIVIKK